ncbi:DUF2306 domain-containing protein [Brevibacillus sp. AY1]|uniref:DUF2306 domain-containing protein n=1 Tax=Brevibacillus sp. AY1 TaxID=2807621 RepID=UPI00246785CC|nr:DUF2306 domain-containing protein [Brevibacillus sp. AY1]
MEKIVRISMILISIMWVFHTFSKNFIVDPSLESFLSMKDQLVTNESLWLFMIRTHIALAIISLLTGPLGVSKAIRAKSTSFHRWNGRIYVLSIFFNFVPGIYVSFFATGGWLSTIGFLLLSSLWLGTTILGYFSIKRKNVILHSQWITRSFFLSFANMTIYIIVAVAHHVMSFSYGHSYTIAVWLSWSINLLLAEWVIRKKILS